MAMSLVISLPSELEDALRELARHKGVTPEAIVVAALREKLGPVVETMRPRDDWERLILQAGADCGVSLPDEALSSEGLYESWRS